MYTVLNQVSGKSFECGGEETVLDGALSNGFNFPYGCQNGFCGQCKAVILNGEVDYDDYDYDYDYEPYGDDYDYELEED